MIPAPAAILNRPDHRPQAQALPFMEGASVYIDLAMTWGAKHGVGVLLDLQAAPGSQNGCAGVGVRVRLQISITS